MATEGADWKKVNQDYDLMIETVRHGTWREQKPLYVQCSFAKDREECERVLSAWYGLPLVVGSWVRPLKSDKCVADVRVKTSMEITPLEKEAEFYRRKAMVGVDAKYGSDSRTTQIELRYLGIDVGTKTMETKRGKVISESYRLPPLVAMRELQALPEAERRG